MTAANVREVLLNGPEATRKTELDLWNHKEKLEAARLKAKLREADVGLQVANAVTPDGKKTYPNEASRDGKVREVLSNDAAFNDARREADEEKAIVARIDAALEYHRSRQRNARALALSASPLDLIFEETSEP